MQNVEPRLLYVSTLLKISFEVSFLLSVNEVVQILQCKKDAFDWGL